MTCKRCGIDIDQHPANTCLDAWVAEAVMGYVPPKKQWPQTNKYLVAPGEIDFGRHGVVTPDNLADYNWMPREPEAFSTSYDGMMLVVDKIIGCAAFVHIIGDKFGPPAFSCVIYRGRIEHTTEADSAPLAVCRAAIKAVKGEQK